MNKYLATVRVQGQLIKTAVFADSPLHARLLLQYQFGMAAVVMNPVLATGRAESGYRALEEVVQSIKPKPPLNPAQARIAGLKQNVERDRQQLQAERDRQRQQRENERRQRQQRTISTGL